MPFVSRRCLSTKIVCVFYASLNLGPEVVPSCHYKKKEDYSSKKKKTVPY